MTAVNFLMNKIWKEKEKSYFKPTAQQGEIRIENGWKTRERNGGKKDLIKWWQSQGMKLIYNEKWIFFCFHFLI